MTTNSDSNWPLNKLEKIEKCPVCKSHERKKIYNHIEDRLYNSPGFWNLYKCKKCRCLYLNPRPILDSIHLAYQNYYTHNESQKSSPLYGLIDVIRQSIKNDYLNWKYNYSKTPSIFFGKWFMYLLPVFLRVEWDFHARHLPKNPNGKNYLLDFGCGQGDFLRQIKESKWTGKGVDIDPLSIAIAKKYNLNVELININKRNLPSHTYDAVTLCHVIEHVHDPLELMRDCFDTLKPGGFLWIVTPNVDSILHKIFKNNWYPLQCPQHIFLLSKQSLKIILQESGYSNIVFHRRGYHIKDRWLKSELIRNNEKINNISSLIKNEKHLKNAKSIRIRSLVLFFEILTSIFPNLQDDLIVTATR